MKQFIANTVLLFGGAGVGLVLALIAAPSPGWSALVGFAGLPLSFFAGLSAWWGLALLHLGWHLVKKVIAREAVVTERSDSQIKHAARFVHVHPRFSDRLSHRRRHRLVDRLEFVGAHRVVRLSDPRFDLWGGRVDRRPTRVYSH